MKNYLSIALAITTLAFTSCEDDDENITPDVIEVVAPATYSFERDGENTVSFSGQTARIQMSQEIISEMLDFENATEASLFDMFSNENSPFENESLNTIDKNVKSKVAASADYFGTDAAASAEIKAFFETQLSLQVSEIFPAQMTVASQGIAGQIPDGESTRYINAQGLEYDQIFGKGLTGALMLDQILNNYLSPAVLDNGANRANNDAEILAEGKSYTEMEHKWDEAFGYIYGNAADAANANATIGLDDNFLNRYVGQVDSDDDFEGIAQEIFNAFKLGRAAIVAKNYQVRDEQAAILRAKISELMAVRSVYYLEQGRNFLEAGQLGTAFHDISEGYGFIYSLQFTQNPDTNAPYFTKAEVDGFLSQFTVGDGLWEVTSETLTTMSTAIAARFDFTVEQAGS